MTGLGAVLDRLSLRRRAEAAMSALPDLLLRAETLVNAALPGSHGQRRAGTGEDFWQYRPAFSGDASDKIDWRRSARSDAVFTRETEAMTSGQAAIWVDGGASMLWHPQGVDTGKIDRARLLALALGLALLRSGERVCILGEAARAGRKQAEAIAGDLFGTRKLDPALLRGGQQVFLVSDWLQEDLGFLSDFLGRAASMGIKGALLQVLDPSECSFPFEGAVEFAGMNGEVLHHTVDAQALRQGYLQRLEQRRAVLGRMAQNAGWHFASHHCGETPAPTLMWAASALGKL